MVPDKSSCNVFRTENDISPEFCRIILFWERILSSAHPDAEEWLSTSGTVWDAEDPSRELSC